MKARFLDLSEELKFASNPDVKSDFEELGVKYTLGYSPYTIYAITCNRNLIIFDDIDGYVNIYVKGHFREKPFGNMVASIDCREPNLKKREAKIKSFVKKLSNMSISQLDRFLNANAGDIEFLNLKPFNRYIRNSSLTENLEFTDGLNFYDEAISLADSKDKDIRKILTKWHFDSVLKKSLIKGLSLSDGKKALYAEIFDGKVLVLVNHSEYGNDSGVYLYLRAKTRKGFPYNLGILHGLTPASARSMFMRIARITDAERLVDFMSKNGFTTFSNPVKKFLDAFENQ